MTKLKICEYPNPILKKKAQTVDVVDDDVRAFLNDMVDTMDGIGVGLAAPQVGVSKRILVIDGDAAVEGLGYLFMVNPLIVKASEEFQLCEEACLSVPGQSSEVERYERIVVSYLDYDGNRQEIDAEGYLAVIIQHEMDHLDGILYIDRISRLKRQMLLKKLDKFRKDAAEV